MITDQELRKLTCRLESLSRENEMLLVSERKLREEAGAYIAEKLQLQFVIHKLNERLNHAIEHQRNHQNKADKTKNELSRVVEEKERLKLTLKAIATTSMEANTVFRAQRAIDHRREKQ